MDTLDASRYRIPLLVVTVVILIWGVLGALDVRNQTYAGYVTDGNNTITRVTDGGPADAAGLEIGDYIRRIGGISVEDLGTALQRPRPEIDEVRTFEVERNGRTLSLDLSYAALPTSRAVVGYGVVLIGFLFLLCGVWAFLTVPTRRTMLLAAFGIAFAVGFTADPYFTSAAVRMAVAVVVIVLIDMGLAVFTHFLLTFPHRKRLLERGYAIWVIYGPATVVALLAFWALVTQPAATSGFNVFFRALFGLLVVGYFGTSLIALIHSYVKANAGDRTANGLNLLLGGAVVGLGPTLVISIIGLFAPQVVVPGAQFLSLGIGVLPVTFALAAVRGERSAQAAR